MKFQCVKVIITGLMFLIVSLTNVSNATLIDGKDWRQVTDTSGLSYNDIAQFCSVSDGACSGQYDGWTWASIGELADLFGFVTGTNTWITDKTRGYSEQSSLWAPSFIDKDMLGPDGGLFDYTHKVEAVEHNTYAVYGLTRDVNILAPDYAHYGYIIQYEPNLINSRDRPDYANTSTGPLLNMSNASTGHWMYKSATVPEPSTLAIFALGMIGLASRRFKKKS